MERVNQFDFYELSRNLNRLNGFTTDRPIDREAAFWVVFWAESHVGELLKGKPVELGVSRAKAEVLLGAINAIISQHFKEENADGKMGWKLPAKGDQPLYGWEWGGILTALSTFETVFAEELREDAAYRVPNRGIYNTRKLVDSAECTFPLELAGHIPEKAKLEWRAAGRCLAFGMFTACGFHVARAVEVVLEAYFSTFNGGPNSKLKTWGQYLDQLENVAKSGTTPAPTDKTLGELKQLKDDWRNPLMHPRVALGEPDARAVFNNGETLIMMMIQELIEAERAGVQPVLALVAGDAGSE